VILKINNSVFPMDYPDKVGKESDENRFGVAKVGEKLRNLDWRLQIFIPKLLKYDLSSGFLFGYQYYRPKEGLCPMSLS
jgi:hypothetical protein